MAMDREELLEYLEQVDHSKEKRDQAANMVMENPEIVEYFLEIAASGSNRLASKACWVIEFTARQDLRFVYEHIERFLEIIPNLREESSIRPMAKICELLVLEHYSGNALSSAHRLSNNHLELMATICFDWLIGPHKVAAKAFSMTCLYHLGKNFSWIHPELKLVLEQNYANESAAYKARARHILPRLKKSSQ